MRTRRLRNAALAAVAIVGIGRAGLGAVAYGHRAPVKQGVEAGVRSADGHWPAAVE